MPLGWMMVVACIVSYSRILFNKIFVTERYNVFYYHLSFIFMMCITTQLEQSDIMLATRYVDRWKSYVDIVSIV